MFDESECQNAYLHRFYIQYQFEEGVIECCEICGQQEFFKVVDGRVDNNHYLAFHARQALLPQDPRFTHEYKNA